MKSITLSSGREFKVASLTVAQTRNYFFSEDGSPKSSQQQMEAAFLVIAASLNNAARLQGRWYRKIWSRKYTAKRLENSLSLAEFRELQAAVVEVSGLARESGEGEEQAAR